MAPLTFGWDPRKAAANLLKHGVSFLQASRAFLDDDAVQFYDDTHSRHEDRFLLLGKAGDAGLLLICYCLRDNGSVIRIISARSATARERQHYPRGAR